MSDFEVDKEHQLEISSLLEEFVPVIKAIAAQLRTGELSDDFAYALVYMLRKDLSVVVRDLGIGVPVTPDCNWAKAFIAMARRGKRVR